MKKLLLKGSAPYLHAQGKITENSVNYVMLNFPFQCNYNCLKCCNRRNLIRSRALVKHYTSCPLTYPEIKQSLQKIKNAFPELEVLVITGEGESLLNSNFRKIIGLVNTAGMIPYIFTNGSLINKGMANFLAENNASLVIQIDSLIPEKYDEYVWKKGAFRKLMKNFQYLRERFSEKFFASENIRIVSLAVNAVLNNENGSQIKKIQKFCGDDIVFVVNEPINIGSASQHWEKFAKAMKVQPSEDISYPLGTIAPGKECSYLRNGISIGSGGQILPCAYALDAHLLFGNIRWNDPAETRKKILSEIDKFYAKYGRARCLLRHPNYREFIERRY